MTSLPINAAERTAIEHLLKRALNLYDKGSVEALEFNVSADFKGANIPLKDLSLRPNTLIAGIIRKRKANIPTGNDVILPGDRVVVIVSGEKLMDLSDILSENKA